jgi:hypothetical protein
MTARQIIERRLGRPLGPIATMPRNKRRAMLLLGLALLASPAFAQDTVYWGGTSSHIRLQTTDSPGAVAEVEFQNAPIHTDAEQTHSLSLGGLTVQADMILGRGALPDRMTITPPEGLIAVPPFVDVPEGQTRVIYLYSADGVAM